jgi:hypothetical protein
LAALAELIGLPPDELGLDTWSKPGDTLVVPQDELELPAAASPAPNLLAARAAGETKRDWAGMIRPDPIRRRTPRQRLRLMVARLVLGALIPLACLLATGLDLDGPGASGPAFVGGVAAVAVTYILLTIAGSLVSGRVRASSRARRMRPPWARGATEWQPPAWTYHIVEEVLIGAAVFSAVFCFALFLTIGGFGE